MTEDQKTTIIRNLRDKGAWRCPVCTRTDMEIAGATPINLNEDFTRTRFSGHVLPCVLVGCNHCGHIAHHALAFLGFPNGF